MPYDFISLTGQYHKSIRYKLRSSLDSMTALLQGVSTIMVRSSTEENRSSDKCIHHEMSENHFQDLTNHCNCSLFLKGNLFLLLFVPTFIKLVRSPLLLFALIYFILVFIMKPFGGHLLYLAPIYGGTSAPHTFPAAPLFASLRPAGVSLLIVFCLRE